MNAAFRVVTLENAAYTEREIANGATTLPEPSEQHNRPHDQAPGRSFRDLAHEIEGLWGRALLERPSGLAIDTPKQSILRAVHRL